MKKLAPILIFFLVIIFLATRSKGLVIKNEITPTPNVSGGQKIKIFLIAMNDNGKTGVQVGCGDSVVSIEKEIAPTKTVLKTSIEELLKFNKDQYYGENKLYNSLYKSNLKLITVSLDSDGKAKIDMTGSYTFKGVCEDARFIAQIEETAKQFPTVKEVEIILNGRNLKDLYKGN